MNSFPVFLLTGPSRIGKTSIVERVVRKIEKDAVGFYSPAIFEDGERVGFNLVIIGGPTVLFSAKKPPLQFVNLGKVGSHYVDLDVIESLMVPILHTAIRENRTAIIDEIGPMEILSAQFRSAILQLLDTNVPVIGTIAKLDLPFLEVVRSHPRVVLQEVSFENRESLPYVALAAIKK